MTTSRKYSARTKDHSVPKVLDQRTKSVLIAISKEPRGRAVDAYLRGIKGT
jgi:hypothetical protein